MINEMSKQLRTEYTAKNLRKQSGSKATGLVFLLLAILVLALGLMMHFTVTGGLPNDQLVEILVLQFHTKFAMDYFVGFFSALFLAIGIHYLKPKQSTIQEDS